MFQEETLRVQSFVDQLIRIIVKDGATGKTFVPIKNVLRVFRFLVLTLSNVLGVLRIMTVLQWSIIVECKVFGGS